MDNDIQYGGSAALDPPYNGILGSWSYDLEIRMAWLARGYCLTGHATPNGKRGAARGTAPKNSISQLSAGRDQRSQSLKVQRFNHVVVEARVEAMLPVLRLGVTGQRNHQHLLGFRPQT